LTLVAITGTPGTGKTSVAAELRSRGYEVVDLGEHIRSHGLLGDLDEERDTHEVDLDLLNDSLEEYRGRDGLVFMEGHLSHFMDCGAIVVLRCEPRILAERLRARGYVESKVRENVQSEILDVILCEAADTDIPVFEIDCTSSSVGACADGVLAAAEGRGEGLLPGRTDWSSEVDEWFLTDRERGRTSRWRRWPRGSYASTPTRYRG
jgi:adenylate kinase